MKKFTPNVVVDNDPFVDYDAKAKVFYDYSKKHKGKVKEDN